MNEPDHMEEIIESGKADVVEMARALLADPFLPKKSDALVTTMKLSGVSGASHVLRSGSRPRQGYAQ